MERADHLDAVVLQYVSACTCHDIQLTHLPDLFDGGMIVLALYSLNFFHPGPLLFAASNDSYGSPGKPPYATSESLAMVNV